MDMDEMAFVSSVLSRISVPLSSLGPSEKNRCGKEGNVTLVARGDEAEVCFIFRGQTYRVGPFLTVRNHESPLPFASLEETVIPLLSALFDSMYGEGGWKMTKLGYDARPRTTLAEAKDIALLYEMENNMLSSIKRGDLSFLKNLSMAAVEARGVVEKRNPNGVRNVQNYSIVLNTLLRKSVEEAGVPPYMVHAISSEFGKRIEKMSTSYGVERLFREMFVSYAALVRNMKRKNYPLAVGRVMFEIDSRYSEELSLSSLSSLVSLSPSYLSRFFKKTTGESVVEYINRTRITQALRLLENPGLKINEISEKVGFQDPAYFSRVFFSLVGVRPERWRKEFLSGKS